MTTPATRPVRRLVSISGVPYIVEISAAGVLLRRQRSRERVAAPWKLVLSLAERLAGEEAHRDKVRDRGRDVWRYHR